jgi:uridylate kinase
MEPINGLRPKYKRIVLKLSGEALKEGVTDGILNFDLITELAHVLKKCREAGVQIAVIVGAGNIWRGRQSGKMNRVRADGMGMLATVINALALQDTFCAEGLDSVVMTSVEMNAFADLYTPRHAVKALEEGKVVIFGGGLGTPFFSTDTPAVIRAAEIEADAVLMAKNIDGVYTDDPRKNPDAVLIKDISYSQIIEKNLKAFDMTAMIFCMENGLNSYAFALSDPMNIYRVVMGEAPGTEMHV